MNTETIIFKKNKFIIYNNDLISSIIKNTNDFYEIEIFNKFKSFIPNKGVFLDIGANIGNHSIMFATHFDNIKIYSFEPLFDNFTILNFNIQKYPNIYPLKVAVGSTCGLAHISSTNTNNQGGAALSAIGEKIPVIDLDSFNFENISFIKIDVEGHEFSVIEGSIKTIINCRPVIWIEDFTGNTINYLVNNFGYKIHLQEHYNNYLLIS